MDEAQGLKEAKEFKLRIEELLAKIEREKLQIKKDQINVRYNHKLRGSISGM